MKNSLLHSFIRKITYFISFLIMLGMNSCEKEDDRCRDNTKIRQVNAEDLIREQMTYNADCRVSEFIQEFSYKKYVYNTQGQLIKTEQSIILDPTSCFMPTPSSGETYTDPRKAPITQYNTYEYDGEGRLSKKQSYFLNGAQFQLVSYLIYDYENGLIRHMNRYNPQHEMTERNTFTYDEYGNIIRDEYFFKETETSFVLMSRNEYVYDDKVNPYRIFENEGLPGLYTNRNNIVKRTFIGYDLNEYSTEYAYEYNASGLPVKMNDLTFQYGD
jgi:hypothetical protein